MAIKDLYDKNRSSDVTMPLKEFVDEHTNLVRILRTGSKKEQMAEADKQEAELKEHIK